LFQFGKKSSEQILISDWTYFHVLEPPKFTGFLPIKFLPVFAGVKNARKTFLNMKISSKNVGIFLEMRWAMWDKTLCISFFVQRTQQHTQSPCPETTKRPIPTTERQPSRDNAALGSPTLSAGWLNLRKTMHE